MRKLAKASVQKSSLPSLHHVADTSATQEAGSSNEVTLEVSCRSSVTMTASMWFVYSHEVVADLDHHQQALCSNTATHNCSYIIVGVACIDILSKWVTAFASLLLHAGLSCSPIAALILHLLPHPVLSCGGFKSCSRSKVHYAYGSHQCIQVIMQASRTNQLTLGVDLQDLLNKFVRTQSVHVHPPNQVVTHPADADVTPGMEMPSEAQPCSIALLPTDIDDNLKARSEARQRRLDLARESFRTYMAHNMAADPIPQKYKGMRRTAGRVVIHRPVGICGCPLCMRHPRKRHLLRYHDHGLQQG